jgi:hypothetical protein
MRPGPRRTCEISKPRAFAEQHVGFGTRTFGRTADACGRAGRGRLPKTCIGPEDLHAGRVHRARGSATAGTCRCRRLGLVLHHDDHDLAARVAGAGDVVLLAVDHPLVAHELGARGDVLGVRRRHARLGHRVGRTDLAVQQRLQPLLLLLGRADRSSTSMLPVSGPSSSAIRTRAVTCRARRRCRRSRGW